MASTGIKLPGTAQSVAGSGDDWSNPNNIKVVGSGAATCLTMDGSDYILGSNFNFNVPAGSTINGIIVYYVIFNDSGSGAGVIQPYNIGAGLIGGATEIDVDDGTTSELQFGDSTDTLGIVGIDSTLVNSSNFGFAFASAPGGDLYTYSVDYIRAEIFYTPPAGGIPTSQERLGAWWLKRQGGR